MKTFAYLGSSKEGGTYRVFETLRDGLFEQGWEGHFVNESLLPPSVLNGREPDILAALVSHLSRYDVVIGNVFISVRLMNVLRFLPAEIPRTMVVHSITRATYLAARSLRDHVHHSIAVSPRIRDDLLSKHGFSAEAVTTVYNAVPGNLFQSPQPTAADGIVKLLSLGRIEERSKRIFLIPEILRNLDPTRYQLTVAGDGPDLEELCKRLEAASIPFKALGRVARDDLPLIYRDHEVFLFPSRFEGMPIAPAEAMASGLVPIASEIHRVTTAFIEDGKSGFIFRQGDAPAAARHLRQLIEEPRLLQRMRQAAYDRALSVFSEERMIAAYHSALEAAGTAPPIAPLALRRWRPPSAMGPGLRGFLPAKLRQRLANLLLYR